MPYHHGNLRQALVEAGLELARRGGPEAVALREATRAAGVSPNAAYRHFHDRDDLVRAVASLSMDRLADLMNERLAALPAGGPAEPAGPGGSRAWARLRAVGRAYVDFALAEPGLFRAAFGVPKTSEPLEPGGDHGPYQILAACLDELVTAGDLPADHRPGAEYPAWSAVHGISALIVDGPLRALPAAEREKAIERVLAAVIEGL